MIKSRKGPGCSIAPRNTQSFRNGFMPIHWSTPWHEMLLWRFCQVKSMLYCHMHSNIARRLHLACSTSSLKIRTVKTEVLHGWQFRPSDVLSHFDDSLQYSLVLLEAASVPGCDTSREDTLSGAPVEVAEYPPVHAKPPHSPEEGKTLVCSPYYWPRMGWPFHILTDMDYEELVNKKLTFLNVRSLT